MTGKFDRSLAKEWTINKFLVVTQFLVNLNLGS